MIGSIEEAAFVKNFIDKFQLKKLIKSMPMSSYKIYLENLIKGIDN